MQVTETLNEGLKRGYTMTLPAQDLEAKVAEKLEAHRENFQMKGFRKGKTPAALMKKMFGKQVLGEALQETVDGALKAHFEETGDSPVQQPQVQMADDDWEEGQDVVVNVSYERLPEVPEVDFKALNLTRLTVEPAEEDIASALGHLADQAKEFETKEGAAEDGDQVVIDFKGAIDGVEFDGGAAEDYPLQLGSGSFIPGFEEQLTGASAGDSKDVKVAFPEDYQAAQLAGKDAVFAVTVKEVKSSKPAEIDDELAKKFGAEDLAQLRERVIERMKEEYGQAARLVMKRELLDQLADAVDFELPAVLLDNEAKQIAHQLWHSENPDVQGHDHPEIEPTEEHTRLAARRVRLGLLLADIGQKNEIQLSDQEVQQAVFNQARQYPGHEQQFVEMLQKNPQMQQQITGPLFEEKVCDFVFELASVTENAVDKDALQAAVEKLEEE